MPSNKAGESIDLSEKLLSMSKRRGFYWPSFEIYGGVAGFYDYGPLGFMLRENIADGWRRSFKGEGFYEIDTPTVNPESVFRSSGHLDFFTDFLVDCGNCHESFRADHLVDMGGEPSNPESLRRKLVELKTKCPRCGAREFTAPRPFNLMFQTQVGPAGSKNAYLRPETAQGIFMNFQQLSRFFRERMPFGVIQRGRGYRNEISPRQGLLRLRELNMLEAELFVDPAEKHWAGFESISGEQLTLLPRKGKQAKMRIGKAVESGVIGSEVLAYFMHLTASFMFAAGVDPARSRFRQHEKDEMAHYSLDTWDFEALLSYGWTELAGVADRGDYDLDAHIRGSSADLRYFRKSREEKVVSRSTVKANRSRLGPVYKQAAKEIASMLEALSPEEVAGRDSVSLVVGGHKQDVSSEFYSVEQSEERVRGEKVIPHVIEPSMGLDRIFYTVLEHSFSDEAGYAVLSLPRRVAPIKAGVFPLLSDGEMAVEAISISNELRSSGIEPYYDDSGSIGRRYARMDEAGTPYCITVDDLTLKEGTVTVRDRDSRKQVRTARASLTGTVTRLLSGEELGAFGEPVETRDEPEIDKDV